MILQESNQLLGTQIEGGMSPEQEPYLNMVARVATLLRPGALLDACQEFVDARGRRLTFEWAMMDGVNDRPSDAVEAPSVPMGMDAPVGGTDRRTTLRTHPPKR